MFHVASERPVQEHFDKKVLDTTGGSVLFLTSIKISEWKCFLALGHTADLALTSLVPWWLKTRAMRPKLTLLHFLHPKFITKSVYTVLVSTGILGNYLFGNVLKATHVGGSFHKF